MRIEKDGRWAEQVGDSDIVACRGFVPERCVEGALAASELEVADLKAEASGGPGSARDASVVDVGRTGGLMEGRTDGGDRLDVDLADEPGAGLCHDGFGALDTDAEGENVTNEANFYDDVRIPQMQEIVEVVADSGVDSGLDTLRTKPISAGGGNDERIENMGSEMVGLTLSRGEGGIVRLKPDLHDAFTPTLSALEGEFGLSERGAGEHSVDASLGGSCHPRSVWSR
jgi:hypothetical protein